MPRYQETVSANRKLLKNSFLQKPFLCGFMELYSCNRLNTFFI